MSFSCINWSAVFFGRFNNNWLVRILCMVKICALCLLSDENISPSLFSYGMEYFPLICYTFFYIEKSLKVFLYVF